MTTTALMAPPASAAAPGAAQHAGSHVPDSDELLAGLPPVLGFVPQAGPPVFAYLGFGVVLLLLLVPPLALLATLVAAALIVAAACAALAVLAAAILKAPFLVVGLLRDHRPAHFSLPAPHVRVGKARRA
jgi:hypothetical protein